MNRSGELGDQMYIVYFIFLLAIISVGIVVGSYSAFGKPYDTRKNDAEVLMTHVSQCIENTPSLSEIKLRNIFITCDFDQSIFDQGLVLSISLKGKEVFKSGDSTICGVQDRYENAPRCTYQIYTLKVDNSIQEVSITAGSNIK